MIKIKVLADMIEYKKEVLFRSKIKELVWGSSLKEDADEIEKQKFVTAGSGERPREKISFTKGGKKMVKKLVAVTAALAAAALFAAAAYAQESHQADVSVTVTPGEVELVLTAVDPSYDFDIVDLGSSSHSITGVVLRNDSATSVDLEKSIESISDENWDLVYGSLDADEVSLWCMSSVEKPDTGLWDTVTASTFSAVGDYNPLVDTDDEQVRLGLSGTTTTWYKIQMPPQTTDMGQKEFNVRFQATTQ